MSQGNFMGFSMSQLDQSGTKIMMSTSSARDLGARFLPDILPKDQLQLPEKGGNWRSRYVPLLHCRPKVVLFDSPWLATGMGWVGEGPELKGGREGGRWRRPSDWALPLCVCVKDNWGRTPGSPFISVAQSESTFSSLV